MKPVELASWRDFSEHKASAWSLLVANALPLLGVLLWGWSTFAIVLIYWAENVVLGVINVLKMIFCYPETDEGESPVPGQAAKFFFVPFFTVHYGGFCAGHGVFVFALLGGEWDGFEGPLGNWSERLSELSQTGAVWAIAAFALSHFFSFVKNYLLGGEYKRSTLPDLMHQPYGRILVLHIAIVLGAFATIALGSPVFLLVILIVGKTALDLSLHLREHRSNKEGNDGDNDQDRGNEGFGAGA